MVAAGAGPDLLQALQQQFTAIAPDLAGSLLYLDAGAGEALAAGLGLAFLQGLGVVHVADLASAGAQHAVPFRLLCSSAPVKLAIITTHLLTDTHAAVMRALQAHPGVTSCAVLCGVSEAAHASHPATSLGTDAFSEYEALLTRELIGLRRQPAAFGPMIITQVRVRGLSGLVVPLLPGTFMLPAASAAAVLPKSALGPAGFGPPLSSAAASLNRTTAAAPRDAPAEGDREEEDEDEDAAGATGLTLLAAEVVGLGAQLGFKLDPFALGATSHAVAAEVCSISPPPGPKGQPPSQPAALVLVDRCLDLATPLQHADHLLDRIFGCLPHRPASAQPAERCTWRPADVRVPLHSRPQPAEVRANGAASPEQLEEEQEEMYGSMLHPGDGQSAAWAGFMAGRRGADAALFLRKWLREALRKEGVLTKGTRFTSGELKLLADQLELAPGLLARHASLWQLARAAAAALEGPAPEAWDAMAAEEARLLHACEDGSEAVLSQLLELLLPANNAARFGAGQHMRVPLPGALQLVLLAHCRLAANGSARLGGSSGFDDQQSRALRDAIVDAAMQQPSAAASLWGVALQPAQPHSLGAQSHADPDEEELRGRGTRLELSDKVEEWLGRVRQLATSDWRAQQERSAGFAVPRSPENQGAGLLATLTGAILEKKPFPGLHPVTGALRGLLKSGLGRFGLKLEAEISPGDYAAVIVFVVGGVGLAEVRGVLTAAAEKQAAGAAVAVIIGGSALLAPKDVLAQVH